MLGGRKLPFLQMSRSSNSGPRASRFEASENILGNLMSDLVVIYMYKCVKNNRFETFRVVDLQISLSRLPELRRRTVSLIVCL